MGGGGPSISVPSVRLNNPLDDIDKARKEVERNWEVGRRNVDDAATWVRDDIGNSAKGLDPNAGEKEAAKQIEEQKRLEGDLREKEIKEEATYSRAQARNKQRGLALRSAGRRSTILTSPLGVMGDDASARKSLLGQ